MRSDYIAAPPAPLASITQAMNDRHFELDANEAAGVIAAFNQARAHGHPFDPFTIALVGVLRRQIAETFEGFEDDDDVADFEDDTEQDWCVTEAAEGDDSWLESNDGPTCGGPGGAQIDIETRAVTYPKARVA